MTKQEQKAIAMLKRMQEPEAWEPQITEEAFEALNMAIEALSSGEDTDVPSMEEFMCGQDMGSPEDGRL